MPANQTPLLAPIHDLMVAGNALAEIIEELRHRSDTESAEARSVSGSAHSRP